MQSHLFALQALLGLRDEELLEDVYVLDLRRVGKVCHIQAFDRSRVDNRRDPCLFHVLESEDSAIVVDPSIRLDVFQ